MKVYQRLAQCYSAWLNCVHSKNQDWEKHWYQQINDLIKDYLPHGSGIDTEISLDFEKSNPDKKLVLESYYHAMNDNGFYDGWYNFKVIITPSLINDMNMEVKGEINLGKYIFCSEYIDQVFYDALRNEYQGVKISV